MVNYLPKSNDRKLSEQVAYTRRKYPQFSSEFKSPSSIRIAGSLQPSARSYIYKFVLKYDLSGMPQMKIVSPKLERNSKNEEIPHFYPSGDLCLYKPKYNEFRRTDFLADTIIPWTSLWLYYYELWHITGDWLGGGDHP